MSLAVGEKIPITSVNGHSLLSCNLLIPESLFWLFPTLHSGLIFGGLLPALHVSKSSAAGSLPWDAMAVSVVLRAAISAAQGLSQALQPAVVFLGAACLLGKGQGGAPSASSSFMDAGIRGEFKAITTLSSGEKHLLTLHLRNDDKPKQISGCWIDDMETV